jgi:hypothetical protein
MQIKGRNINDVFHEILSAFPHFSHEENSRNGKVLTIPEPTTLCYNNPTERVLFWPQRDANPYFHLMEALWMLNGSDDVAWPKYFSSKFGQYSDDGVSLNGAYGARWRRHFGIDQIIALQHLLERDPTTRRAVMAMWDPARDLVRVGTSKDVPCNTQIYFRVVFGTLQMTVCNRSNDLIWGACGSNVVHFSMLQELLARSLQLDVGEYYQITNNLHIYDYIPNRELYGPYVGAWDDPYLNNQVEPYPLIRVTLEQWLEDLHYFMLTPLNRSGYHDPFFEEVAVPIMKSWEARKNREGNGLSELEDCKASDWKRACAEWILRRETNAV